MTDKEQKDLRIYCAFLLKEYGFHISPNDPIIPALYIIHREMQLTTQSNRSLASLVKEASASINPTQYHFQYPGEAWKFQLGIALKWFFVGLIAVLLVWAGVWYWSMVKDIDKARIIIEASGPAGELIKAMQKDEDGYYFIDFTAPKGDSVRGFKEFRKLNVKTVRVYLGKDQ
jgi:hypothetical protein